MTTEEAIMEVCDPRMESVKAMLTFLRRCIDVDKDYFSRVYHFNIDEAISWVEERMVKIDNLAELADGEVTTSNGMSEDMMSLRIEHTPLSSRAKNLLRYQFDTIGDLVSYCDGKWRRLRALRNVGNVTYNEIMEYLGVDDRL